MMFLSCSRTSLIRTPKGQSKVSVLERCPFYRGHHDDVTFKTPLTVEHTPTHASKSINNCLQRNAAPKTVIL